MGDAHYDLIIIGGGPAGMTAGLYAARSRMNVLLIEKVVLGGQILITDWIENYPGFPEGISGCDLAMKMNEQASKFGLKTESDQVVSLNLSSSAKEVSLLSGKTITAKSIIIATGASPRKLDVTGEDRLIGKGVSFCGTCDGPFFRDKVVAAVGGGDTAVQESIYLTKFVKKVYLIHRRSELRATKILQERAFSNKKIEFVWDSCVKSVNGEMGVESVTIKNLKKGSCSDLAVDGCFVWIGTLPNNAFIGNSLKLDDYGFIITNERMETSAPGVYAVGDVRNTPVRQIASAVGDAAIAAYLAEQYIEDL